MITAIRIKIFVDILFIDYININIELSHNEIKLDLILYNSCYKCHSTLITITIISLKKSMY